MTPQQAKEILALYRPGTADTEDASFVEARELCARDPELNRWFVEHCAVYTALRAKFKQIPVPEGFKEQILAERKVHTTAFLRRPVVLAAVAVVAVLTVTVTLWLQPREVPGYSVYLNRIVSHALLGYNMELETSDLRQIQAYLAQRQAPADYVLPQKLQQASAEIGRAHV